jgi:hypothetical protein
MLAISIVTKKERKKLETMNFNNECPCKCVLLACKFSWAVLVFQCRHKDETNTKL